jgi:hypothetical protein
MIEKVRKLNAVDLYVAKIRPAGEKERPSGFEDPNGGALQGGMAISRGQSA